MLVCLKRRLLIMLKAVATPRKMDSTAISEDAETIN